MRARYVNDLTYERVKELDISKADIVALFVNSRIEQPLNSNFFFISNGVKMMIL